MKWLGLNLVSPGLLCLLSFAVHAADIDQALSSYENRQYLQAEKQFLKLAGKGSANAQYYLGQLYRLGHIGEPDINRAVEYYEQAATRGHTQAMRNLGAVYYYGNLGEPDFAKAYEWIKKAAEGDDTWSQWLVAIMYHNGDGIEKDSYKAYQWASIAAHKGHLESQHLRDEIKKQLSVSQLHQADQLDRLLDSEPVARQALNKTATGGQSAVSRGSTGASGKYTVQFAAFRDQQRAQAYLEKLSDRKISGLNDIQPRLLQSGNLFKVVAGEFDALDSAMKTCSELRSGTLDCFVTRY